MCQEVTGPEVVLEEQDAWKIVRDSRDPYAGLYFRTEYTENGWAPVVAPLMDDDDRTYSGYHVFTDYERAVKYAVPTCRCPGCRVRYAEAAVIPVRIRGRALPFRGGYAVEQWRLAE